MQKKDGNGQFGGVKNEGENWGGWNYGNNGIYKEDGEDSSLSPHTMSIVNEDDVGPMMMMVLIVSKMSLFFHPQQ